MLTKVTNDLLALGENTSSLNLPKGTTAQRPSSPVAGMVRENTDDNVIEYYNGTEWKQVKSSTEPILVDYLVVAGGGAGAAGGAGAGGLRTSIGSVSGGGCSIEDSITLNPGTSYNILVGGGGAGSGQDGGENGFSSSFSTITSIGGGRSGLTPLSGGSGAGAYYEGSPSSGTSCQGYSGGTMATDYATYTNFGGGGGAGQVGGNASGAGGSAGKGGDGIQSLITGTATYYSGGGGGYAQNGTSGSGGLGGGGTGGNGNNGSPNTGGGAGGYNSISVYNQGGSGVVILRLLTSQYSGTTTGSPTITTDGSYTVLTYTQSGTYTA